MPVISGQEWTFNTVAASYEKFRPGYPDALYQTIFAYAPLDETCRAVEIGIGGGQATLPVLETGCQVIGVEYGDQLAALCREKFRSHPNFSVITAKFEDVDFPDGSVDLVYSASAFHWVLEKIGYPKVYHMLKPGGTFARFANHPFRAKDNTALFEAINDVYAEYYYTYYPDKKQPEKYSEYTEEEAAQRAKIAGKYGFTDMQYALFYRKRTLSASDYRALIGTYSDHIAMEKNVRDRFFDRMEETINLYGGSISVFDTIDLQLARKA